MTVIEVEGVSRAYGETPALRDVSFRVDAGEVVGLLGPNGAGKTTIMKVLTGLLAPQVGRVRVLGHDVVERPVQARAALGWLPEGAPLYEDMTARALLGFTGKVRGLGPSERAVGIHRVAVACQLEERLDEPIGQLSRGLRQRVGLAVAMLHEPPLLVLDEPTTGLDPHQVAGVRELVRELGRSRTVLLSTHLLSEAQALCDRILILYRGEIVADDQTERVLASAEGLAYVVGLGPSKVQATEEVLREQLLQVDGVSRVQPAAPLGDSVRFEVHARRDVRADLFRWAVDRGHVLVELGQRRQSLEDVFRSLTEAR